jgi:hypothetical protein
MKVLNVGGNSKDIPIPACYNGWEHHLLDIDPIGKPDICCDAVLLKDHKEYKDQYDSVYCSHNLEHFYRHKVPDVLAGFQMVLNKDGFCYIIVPHIMNLFRKLVAYNMELTDTIYEASGVPIMAHDMIYGWGRHIEKSGVDFFSHKCAFTPKMLYDDLIKAGFPYVYIIENGIELRGVAFKESPEEGRIHQILR